jgi:hypothetical protein
MNFSAANIGGNILGSCIIFSILVIISTLKITFLLQESTHRINSIILETKKQRYKTAVYVHI